MTSQSERLYIGAGGVPAGILGRSACSLTEVRCNELLARVQDSMTRATAELSEYRSTHPEFEAVGEKMTAAWAAGLAKSISVQ